MYAVCRRHSALQYQKRVGGREAYGEEQWKSDDDWRSVEKD